MDKKKLLKEIGYKLNKIRDSLHLNTTEMAACLESERTSYIRYEQGQTPPKITTLFSLGESYGISLDWLIRNKGPMYFKETENEVEAIKEPEKEIDITNAPPAQPTVDSLPDDIRELLDHMEKIPLLRYEVLAFFLKFKDKNKEMVAKAFAGRAEEKNG
jgi:transcriptional regulator with XRE-family HTH domain